MEYNVNGIAEWLFEAEQDFTFGAKAASCLHPATIQDAAKSSSSNFDWMETRDNLGLTNIDLFEDVMLPNDFKGLPSTTQSLAYGMEEEDYSNTIKPEDMLVPLSELQPQENPPQRISTVPVPEPPKVTINVKKVIIPTMAMKNNTIANFSVPQATTSAQMNLAVPSQKTQFVQPDNQDSSLAEADDLLNEWIKIVGKEPHLEELDSSMVEDFQELLSQLETGDSQLDTSDVSSWGSEPASPVSLPSPVPSCGSVSPAQSNSDSSFLNIYSPKSEKSGASPYAASEVAWSPGEASFGVPSSPLTIDKSALSPADVTPVTEADWSRSELHSYSRSPSKRKSRKASARAAPYPENKRERKKEQNKQAALRYRQKKKQEDDEIMTQIAAEEERQKQLQEKYKNLKQELTCMKKIMREVFIAKGVISADAFKKK
ncbi:cyclic AMP-dependent transcription factor ATF-4-like isoform X2 [Penaeus japonicus]|uniref:cyclic AMP-dependent transcription factor ATF-4-like isoform X2 n=1 Tax=Penaeus japonicus TaxID=27405 RepID=UPI001C715CB4|nr:cyclic AMP-dependent transcription factor ATF-4-like isoform X2 [Penaeus japonicus]